MIHTRILLLISILCFGACKRSKPTEQSNHSKTVFCINMSCYEPRSSGDSLILVFQDYDFSKLANSPDLKNVIDASCISCVNFNLDSFLTDISSYTTLRSIYLENCGIAYIGVNFKKCKRLKELTLYDSSLIDIKEADFPHHNLKSVSMRYPFDTIPDFIFKFHRLVKLNLSDNYKIATLPSSIGNLSQLQELYLSNTSVSKIPIDFYRLKNLMVLDLYNTPLAREEMSFFKKHKRLNHLERLQKALPSCKIYYSSPAP